MLGLAGVTAIATSAAAVTLNTVAPGTPPSVALILDVHVDNPLARPRDALAVETVATAGLSDAQVRPRCLAVIAVITGATAVATLAGSIVAAASFGEAQVTWPLRSCVVLSEKVPVAVNCRVSPWATLGLAGVTAIATSARA